MGEAEARFAAGEHDAAARLWGRTTGAGPSFEETALRFVDAGATSALQAFLLARLDALGPEDRAQARDDQALCLCGDRGVCLLAWVSWRFNDCGLLFSGGTHQSALSCSGEFCKAKRGVWLADGAVCMLSTLACCPTEEVMPVPAGPTLTCKHAYIAAVAAGVCFCFQATMVATWLVELLLDQINRALLEDTPEARAAVDDYTARLRAFLKVFLILHMTFSADMYL